FDHSITAPDEIKPVKGEYFRFNLDSLSVGTYAAFGDSFSVIYAENGRNITVLEGEASYIDTRVLFRGSGGVGNFSGAAGMFNVWNAKFENLSAEPGLLAGQHRIEGVTQINDLNDEIDLDVVINLNMRANSSGEATIWVEGIKRVEIDFSGYDVHFRGKVSLAMDDFEREYNF
ncbi:MAG: hypothetical protein RAP03_02715, partial [Candidatus Electryonea clarkiae]|nr:hypothetical protein [Candidatus Electryonea clarkiae]